MKCFSMKLIFCAALLVFWLTACKNGNVNGPDVGTMLQSDTISQNDTVPSVTYDSEKETFKEVKQYDSEGRRTGFWTYEEYGWIHKEHYVDGVLDGHATYTDDERINQIERTRIEMDYCKGVECGEMKIFFEGKPGLHLTNITKVDTVIEGFRLGYRAYIKEYLDDGKTVRFEGVGYYGDNGSLLAEGYWCVGRWKIYDTKSKPVKTATVKKPDCEIKSYVYSLGI